MPKCNRRFDGAAIIMQQPPRVCEMCGAVAECRPYGPDGQWVCFECGMKDEPEAIRRFLAILKAGGRKSGNA